MANIRLMANDDGSASRYSPDTTVAEDVKAAHGEFEDVVASLNYNLLHLSAELHAADRRTSGKVMDPQVTNSLMGALSDLLSLQVETRDLSALRTKAEEAAA